MDIKRTGSFDIAAVTATIARTEETQVYGEVVEGLVTPAVVLDNAGLVVSANGAFAELLQVDRSHLAGEPLLTWIRGSEREAFGREFMGLKRRRPGFAFQRDLAFRPVLGPPARVRLRATKLGSGHALLTVESAPGAGDPETELGRAVTRALDALDQGVLLVDGHGRIVHVNPAAKGLLGDGLIGRGFLELAPPAAVQGFARALNLARAGNWHGEVDLLRLDGDAVPVELSIAAGSGEGAPAVVLCRDLRAHRRRQFEERLLTQVDRALISSTEPREAITEGLQALATGLGALRVVVLTHFGGAWERWEVRPDAGPEYTRLPPGLRPPGAWVQGHSVEAFADPDELLSQLFGEFARRASGVRITLRAPGGVVGYLLVSRDRRETLTPEDVQLLTQLAPQLALGLANGLLMLETRALAAYQGRILDQTAVLLNSVDAEGRVVTWNRASERLIGMSVEEATGKLFGVEAPRTSDPALWEELWQELVREGVITSEVTFVDADGDEVPLHLEGRVLRDGREVTGAVFVGLDLRQRRALEGQVLRTQKLAAVGLLAAGIAHEINNPLSGVVGYSRLLLEKSLPQPIRDKVERIAASGERCRKIVEGVLLFSRQHGGERARVDLAEVIDRVTRIGEYQWKMHNVRILREIEGSAQVMADPDQIEQVLLNLLSNAVDAMPQGGTIRVALRPIAGGGAELSVADQGVGIPAEIRDSIFDPFFSTKEIGKGTGLGLAISYGIVRDHGGDILLESAPGQGTTFTIVLPHDGKPLSAAAQRRAATTSGREQQR